MTYRRSTRYELRILPPVKSKVDFEYVIGTSEINEEISDENEN